jgi:tetratricopeptide (TPR) repeat protein
MKGTAKGLRAYNEAYVRLHTLIDEDPARAVHEARALSSDIPARGVTFASLKAAVLIDAGSSDGDKQAIEDGVILSRQLATANPKQPILHYNLGNGLFALADLEPYAGYDWYLTTAATRREGRAELQQAISSNQNHGILSVALTNLGNALWKAYRWVEAYDAYSRALAHDASNAVASTGAAKVLLRCVERGIGNKKTLESVAARHLATARLHPERIAQLAGANAQKHLTSLLEERPAGGIAPDLSRSTEYEKFVAAHRLALSPTIEGLNRSLKRWDSLRFHSIMEPVGTTSGVPAIFAMFNVMKSDFLAARYLAYQALTSTFPESGFYSDTLDYAVYGVLPSMLSLAQRACIDVLDKIAVATTEYFAIPAPPKVVYFTNRWFAETKKGQPPAWHPSLRSHIDKGNTALIALAEISLDVGEGGALQRKKAFRHSSTHRFTVLHDLGCNPSRESVHVEHCEIADFKSHLIESLQLARAAMLYFVEMIASGEQAITTSRVKKATIKVPSHHYIRGEDNRKPQIRRPVSRDGRPRRQSKR